MVVSAQSMASTERRDTYTSRTTALVPLPCLAPNSRRRTRGFVQLDVYAALTVATAVLTSASPRKRLLVNAERHDGALRGVQRKPSLLQSALQR